MNRARGRGVSPSAQVVIWLALAAGLALSGCALVRPTDPYRFSGTPASLAPGSGHGSGRTPPATPSSEEAPDEEARIPSGPMDLRQAIDLALAGNPELAATAWDASAAQARRDQTAGARLPRLGLTSSYSHHRDEQRLLPIRSPGDPTTLSRDIISGDLVLTMPLFTGGQLVNQVRAAELLGAAATHRLARNREELVYNVSSVFFGILAQGHVIESLESSRRSLEEHLKRIDALISAQKGTRVERLRVEVRLADLKQRLVREINALAIQRRVLGNLLGLGSRSDAVALQDGLAPPPAGSLPDLQTSMMSAQAHRDDYLAARAALEAQARAVDAARAESWPSLFLLGTYGVRWAVGPWTGAGDELGEVGRISLMMEIPLFDGGRVSARVREQRAQLGAARERLRRLELQLELEVEAALLDVTSTRERAAALDTAIEQAQESLRIEQQKHELGRGAIVDVLDAQAALLEAQTNYFRVLAELHTALANLRLATGEPW